MRRGQRRERELLKSVVAAPNLRGWNDHRGGNGNRRVHEKAAVERDNYIGLSVDVEFEAVRRPAAKSLDIQVGKAYHPGPGSGSAAEAVPGVTHGSNAEGDQARFEAVNEDFAGKGTVAPAVLPSAANEKGVVRETRLGESRKRGGYRRKW
jgi:hypothetical protein